MSSIDNMRLLHVTESFGPIYKGAIFIGGPLDGVQVPQKAVDIGSWKAYEDVGDGLHTSIVTYSDEIVIQNKNIRWVYF